MLSKSISRRLATGQAGIGLRWKISSARRRNWRIQSGSFLYSEIFSTISRFSPRFDLKNDCSGSLKPYLYSLVRSCALTAMDRHLLLLGAHAQARQQRLVAFGLELLDEL